MPFLQKTPKGAWGVGRPSRAQSEMKGRHRLEHPREVAEGAPSPPSGVTSTPRASGQPGPGAVGVHHFVENTQRLIVQLFLQFVSRGLLSGLHGWLLVFLLPACPALEGKAPPATALFPPRSA